MTTWRGALRELDRAAKRNAREKAYREKQRAIAEIIKESQKILEEYNKLINSLVTLHIECCEVIDWKSVIKSNAPKTVNRVNYYEKIAREKKANYRPSRLKKFFGKADKEASKFEEEIILAIERDEEQYRYQIREYEKEKNKWQNEKELASRILKGEDKAIEKVLKTKLSLKTNSYIGTKMMFHFEKRDLFEAQIKLHEIDIIPSYDLRQLKSGKLSRKDMPKSRRFEIYKEYACSATIRIAREIFALISLKEILVNAKCDQLNQKTGYKEEVIILSAFIPRVTLEELNFKYLKPSIAIENFVHNIDFKKYSGFNEVNEVSIENKFKK